MINKEIRKPTEEEKTIGEQLIMTHLNVPMQIPDIGNSTVVRDYIINGMRFQITLLNVSECYRRKKGYAKGVWLLADRYISLDKNTRRLMCCASIRLS